MPHSSEFAVFPVTLVVAVGDKAGSVSVPTREKLMHALSKFAMRLEPNERGYLLMLLGELPEKLPHYWAATGEGWRVNFHGAIGTH